MSIKEILLKVGMAGILVIPYHIKTISKKTHKEVKKNVGSAEIFFLLRRGLSELINFVISPLLILKLDFTFATILIFAITLFVTLFFILITDLFKNDTFQVEALKFEISIDKKIIDKPGVVVKILRFLYRIGKYFRIGKSILYSLTFPTEPLYLTLLVREGHHKYNGIPNFKVFTIFFLSSVASSVLWSYFLLFFKPYIIYMVYLAISVFFLWIAIKFIAKRL